MRAIVLKTYGGPEQLSFENVPRPNVGPKQVLIRIKATSLNPVDLKRASGVMRQVFPVNFPFIPGGDFSGVIEQVGPEVSEFHTGDEVFGYVMGGGAYAEFIAMDEDKVALKPTKLNDSEAAALAIVAQTALQAIERADLKSGQTVLIHGAGGAVGSLALQLAKSRGAYIIAVAYAASRDRLIKAGADQVLLYEDKDFTSRVKDVDLILDTIGGDVQQQSFALLKPGGLLISFAQPPSQEDATKFGVGTEMLFTQTSKQSLEQVAALADAGTLSPFLGPHYPLSEVAKGWSDSRAKHVEGKIIFLPAD